MEFEIFTEKVIAAMKEYADGRGEVRLNKVMKNNSVELTGICIFREGANITPTVYIDDYFKRYNRGEDFDDLMNEVIDIYEKHKDTESFDLSFFKSFDTVKDRLVYKLICIEKNETLLKEIPYVPYLDMAVVFYYMLPEDSLFNASILVYNNHIKSWGVGVEEVKEAAFRNTPCLLNPRLSNMETILMEVSNKWKEEAATLGRCDEWEEKLEHSLDECTGEHIGEVPMFVLTNERKFNGAACILYRGILKQFSDRLNQSFFILPSSVHEVILVPESEVPNPTQLSVMVRDINSTQVAADEVLSDSVYFYDYSKEELKIYA